MFTWYLKYNLNISHIKYEGKVCTVLVRVSCVSFFICDKRMTWKFGEAGICQNLSLKANCSPDYVVKFIVVILRTVGGNMWLEMA